jgi:hypothetical protein
MEALAAVKGWRESEQGVLSLEKSPNRRHDMLHTVSVVGLSTPV